MKHLDIAGLLPVEVLRRSDGDLQAEDRPHLPDRLGVSIVDHERPQPLLEHVRILALRQVELGVQGGGFDAVVAGAGPLDGDRAEDRQIGTLVRLIEPGKFLVRVRGRIPGNSQGRTNVPGPGHVQECLEHPAADHQELPKEGLLDLMNRLLLVGGVLHAFDQVPERLESFVDLRRARLLLEGRREIELDGGYGGRKHESGSSSLWCVPGLTTSWNIPREEGPFEAPSTKVEILKH